MKPNSGTGIFGNINQNLENISMKSKLGLLLVLPFLGLLYFSANAVMEKSNQISDTGNVLAFSTKAGNLVHELQKERGMSALYLGSKGTKFGSELQAQRGETDRRLLELKEFLKGFDTQSYGSGFKASLESALSSLEMLKAKRDAVSSQTISTSEALDYYTKINTLLLDAVTLAGSSSGTKISSQVSAYVSLMQAKERAGIERALLSSAFAADRFEKEMFSKFVTAVAEQDVYTKNFLLYATPEQKSFYEGKLSGKFVDETARMRKLAFDKANEGRFGVDAAYWFEMQTGKIDLLKEVENKLADGLSAEAERFKQEAERARNYSALLAIASILLPLFFAFLIMRNILKPLSSVVSMAESIAAGDLTVEALESERKDEIGVLMQAQNKMLANLRPLIARMQESSHMVSATAQELAASGEEMNATTEQVSTTVQQISQGAQAQAKQVEEASRELKSMSEMVRRIAESAQAAAQISSKASASAQEGSVAAREAVAKMGEIHSVTNNSAGVVKTLGSRSQQIGEIVSVITNIAEQTNLLALNAAIEAARAGEHGRGFAVVAEEVRKLAEGSAKAAKQIQGMIRDMSSAAEKMSESVIKSIQDITLAVREAASRTEEASAATEEQTASMEELSSTAQDLANLANQMRQSTSRFKA